MPDWAEARDIALRMGKLQAEIDAAGLGDPLKAKDTPPPEHVRFEIVDGVEFAIMHADAFRAAMRELGESEADVARLLTALHHVVLTSRFDKHCAKCASAYELLAEHGRAPQQS